jgi:hypothetical protein
MKPLGGTALLNKVVAVSNCTNMLPSVDGPGTAVVAGAVRIGQSGLVPTWPELHGGAAEAADSPTNMEARNTTVRINNISHLLFPKRSFTSCEPPQEHQLHLLSL